VHSKILVPTWTFARHMSTESATADVQAVGTAPPCSLSCPVAHALSAECLKVAALPRFFAQQREESAPLVWQGIPRFLTKPSPWRCQMPSALLGAITAIDAAMREGQRYLRTLS